MVLVNSCAENKESETGVSQSQLCLVLRARQHFFKIDDFLNLH